MKPRQLKEECEKDINKLLKVRKIHFQHMEAERLYSPQRAYLKAKINENSRMLQILRDKWRFINEKYNDSSYSHIDLIEFNKLWEKTKQLRYDKRLRKKSESMQLSSVSE